MRLMLIAGVVVSVALLSTGAAAAAPGASLSFATDTFEADLANGQATLSPVLANDSDNDVEVTFSFLANGGQKATVTPNGKCSVGPHTAAACSVTLKTEATSNLSGTLVATGATVGPAFASVSLSSATNVTTVPTLVLLVSLAAAVLLMALRARRLPPDTDARKFTLRSEMGGTKWKFSDSWASSLTAVGAVLGTVLSAKLLSENARFVSDKGFTALNLLFGGLVVLSPFVYAAIQRLYNDPPSADGPEYVGPVWAFFISAVLTTWAVLGELATLGVGLFEIDTGFNQVALIIPLVMLVVALVLTGGYVWKSTYSTIYWYVKPPPPAPPPPEVRELLEAVEMPSGVQRMIVVERVAPPPDPRWPLL
jgi:hypothetical protein